MDPEDSGWQFLCDSGAEERIEDAQIWSIAQVVKYDPSMADFVKSPTGTVMCRVDSGLDWQSVVPGQ